MSIQMFDKSSVSVRYKKGQCKLTFHGCDKVMILPVSIVPTIGLIEKLYIAIKN
jgi:uncharacterized membrane protein